LPIRLGVMTRDGLSAPELGSIRAPLHVAD
jgi:hypothetical protein